MFSCDGFNGAWVNASGWPSLICRIVRGLLERLQTYIENGRASHFHESATTPTAAGAVIEISADILFVRNKKIDSKVLDLLSKTLLRRSNIRERLRVVCHLDFRNVHHKITLSSCRIYHVYKHAIDDMNWVDGAIGVGGCGWSGRGCWRRRRRKLPMRAYRWPRLQVTLSSYQAYNFINM